MKGTETEALPRAAIMQVDIRAWSGGGGGGSNSRQGTSTALLRLALLGTRYQGKAMAVTQPNTLVPKQQLV